VTVTRLVENYTGEPQSVQTAWCMYGLQHRLYVVGVACAMRTQRGSANVRTAHATCFSAWAANPCAREGL